MSSKALLPLLAISLLGMVSCVDAASPAVNSVTVPVTPIVLDFRVDPSRIENGQHATLTWRVSHAARVEIQPGIGSIEASGSVTVYPSEDTTFTLTASNGAEEVTSYASISVNPAPQEPGCQLYSCDPVSGRNADLTLLWEQLCQCAEYRLQIAKDDRFSMVIYDRKNFRPYATTSPGLVYLAGGILECGHTYYVRVRCLEMAEGQRVRSPWSYPVCITIGAGLPVAEPYK